jgi:hypothetical protein
MVLARLETKLEFMTETTSKIQMEHLKVQADSIQVFRRDPMPGVQEMVSQERWREQWRAEETTNAQKRKKVAIDN